MTINFPNNPKLNTLYTYNKKNYRWNGSSWGFNKVSDIWVRNPSWPDCEANAGDNKIVGLYAVLPGDGTGNGGNFFAVTISGNYNIDYGDGTVTDYTAATTAYYEFNYNNPALNGTDAPVTFTASTDTVNRTAHGYIDGNIVRFYNIVTTTGLTENTAYYVINATANTFQVSLTENGTPVALTNDGSATLLPYKIATVTITPQSGADLTNVNFFKKHNQTNLVSGYSTGWLELAVACPLLTALAIGSSNTTVKHGYLEKVNINQLGNITSFYNLFYNCKTLKEVSISNTITTLTNTNSMFYNCYSLTKVTLFNTSSVSDMSFMFCNCYSLSLIPKFNTSSVNDMSSMFNNCHTLKSVLNFDTSSVFYMGSMFYNCFSLTYVPLLDTSAVVDMSSMFYGCYSINKVPFFDTSSVNNMNGMFRDCFSLTEIPAFNTSLVTNMSNMFNNCYSLEEVPFFNTSSVTTFSGMLGGCKITTVPLFDTSSAINTSYMFTNCNALTEIPAFDLSAVTSSTNFNSMFSSCFSLTKINATGINYTFSVASCKLSAAALDEIYTNLPTVTGQTITVLGNYGITDDDPTIATAKGWTVVG